MMSSLPSAAARASGVARAKAAGRGSEPLLGCSVASKLAPAATYSCTICRQCSSGMATIDKQVSAVRQ
jgi:hypothetical protein